MGNADQTTPPGGAPFGDESLDEVLKVFFEDDPERDGDSVLEQISRLSGSEPRILLRDDVADDTSPILKALPRSGPGSIENDRRYLVMGEIARGGVGIVYKSRDRDLGRNVALKVLRPDHADNPDVIDRFVEEAQVEGQLQHPNIVPVYGLGMQPDGRPYFVMKLVKGQTLSARMQGREDPTEDRHIYLTAFEQVSRAMAYSHARGVIHRDLKPANVMIGAFGEVQVMDWGFAKVLGREDEPTETEPAPDMTIIATKRSAEDGSQSIAGSVMGTPAYMPPEQALGRVAELDERSDVFSLGAILCEILTGEPPYVGEPADLLVMAAQCRQDEAHERLDASSSAPALIDLVKRCLAPLRADRPENAGAVGREIHEHLAEIAEKARLAEVAAAEETARQEEQNAQLAREKLRVEKLKARVAEELAESEREREEETRNMRRARADRRARMGVLALAAVLLLAVLLGGYGWLRHGREEQQRLREVSGEVTAALQLATDHEGRQEWGRALETAITARDLARTADEATRTRADTILARIEEGKVRADAEKKRRDRDDAFLARGDASATQMTQLWLEDLAQGPDPEHGAGKKASLWTEAADAAVVEHYRKYGLDFDVLDPKAAAERIRASAHAVEIACRLTSWASNRAHSGLDGEPLLAVARLADPDPWRNRLRDVMLDGDPTPLIELSESERFAEQPGSSLSLLAGALWSCMRDRADALRAVEVTRWAQRRSPDSVWLLLQLSERLLVVRNPREARHWIQVARAKNPESDYLVAVQARVLANCRDFDEAERLCWKAIAGSSRPHPDLYWVLAWISDERGDFPEVLKRYDEYIKHAPPAGKANALHRISILLHGRGKSQEAMRRAEQACKADPTSHNAQCQFARLHVEARQYEQACEIFKRACETNPLCGKSWFGWTNSLRVLGRADLIATVVNMADNLDPGQGIVPFVRGAARAAENDLPGAIEAYREAIEKGQWRRRLILVRALTANEQFVEALVEARKAVRLAPRLGWNELAVIYNRLGMFDRALEAQLEDVSIQPSPIGSSSLAIAYFLTGKVTDAWRELERANGLFPDHWAILLRNAQYHFVQDQPEKTIRIYGRLIERDGHTMLAHWGRGEAHAAMGNFPAAVDDLRVALDLHRRARIDNDSLPRYVLAELERRRDEYRAIAECAGRLKTIQNGSERAMSIEETLTFAKLCHYTRHDDSAVRYFRRAFEVDPVAARNLDSGNPRQAAASAARAAGRSSAQNASVLRRQAHEWMARWLALLRKRLQSGVLDDRILVRRHIWAMKGGPGFAAVRGEAIDAMPEAERKRWRAFWRDLDEFLREASREGE